jgi:hypothetical protein
MPDLGDANLIQVRRFCMGIVKLTLPVVVLPVKRTVHK